MTFFAPRLLLMLLGSLRLMAIVSLILNRII